jgi:hypothetical protein
VLGHVKGDVHDIGKNLVDIILSNNGYERRQHRHQAADHAPILDGPPRSTGRTPSA